MMPWDDLLSAQDRAVIEQAGYGRQGASSWDSRGVGTRPALIVIDMQRFIVGRDVPILEAIGDHRAAMGSIAWRALEHITPFVEACRAAHIPAIYTRVIPAGRDPGEPDLALVDALQPQPEDVIIDKRYASAFHGTDLLARLRQQGIDTLIVTGNSTSGCVRATVVDARQHGIHPIVPIECVFDRIEASHKINLLDMWMKYAAVMPATDALDYVRQTTQAVR